MALGLDLRVIDQAHGDGMLARWRHQQGLIDVEHRITLAIAGQAENRHRGLDHLADFGLALGDHPVRLGHQGGVAQLFTGVGQLCLSGLEGALAAAQSRFGRVVLTLAGVTLGQ
ncbi:hypothetical protein D3C76_1053210 [compost metagenome]